MTSALARRVTGPLAALTIAIIPALGDGLSASAATDTTAKYSQSQHRTRGYVALGDSFSSGEGTGVYSTGTDSATNRCRRSPIAYAPLLQASSKRLGPLSFVACSGAVTRDLYVADPANSGQGPQLDALRKRTKAVTMTIGGNDVVFAAVATACVKSVKTAGFGCSKNAALNSVITARLGALAGTATPADPTIIPIKKILTDIAATSPRAKIYLAGYPELFGDTFTHYSIDRTAPSDYSCVVNPAFGARVDYADARWINAKTRELNSVLRAAVRQAKNAGVKATYVSPSTFDGHGLCDDRYSWINPVLVSSLGAPLSESLHPTATGQKKGYLPAFQRAGL